MSTTSPTTTEEAPDALLVIRGLKKRFRSTIALRGVDLTVHAGEVKGLLGPNGAGKSTLIKILTGIHRKDEGELIVRSARHRGEGRVGVVHQDLGLVDALTVRENLSLGRPVEKLLGFMIAVRAERRRALVELATVGLDIDPETPLSQLSIGQKTLVAVARLLAMNSDVIVLDEVTAALTQRESDWLLDRVHDIAAQGVAIVLVSHRLHEIVGRCDTVTVIRDGAVAFDGTTPTIADLHTMLMDSAVDFSAETAGRATGEVLLTLAGARTAVVGPIDLEVRGGEVLGLVGPLSSGLYAIGHLLAGKAPLLSGRRVLTTEDGHEPVAFLAEDRKQLGALPFLDLTSNMTISSLHRHGRFGFVRPGLERASAESMVTLLDIRPADVSLGIETLSGGNQQKVLLARCALAEPRVYVLCEPTRGVDVATRHAIYRFIDEKRGEGAAVVVISIDADDILAVSDRVSIVEEGTLTTPVPRSTLSATTILEAL